MASYGIECCGQLLVRSENEYAGRWMCEECNKLFDKMGKPYGPSAEILSPDDFVIDTGMYGTREEQGYTQRTAKALSEKLGHANLFDNVELQEGDRERVDALLEKKIDL